jgi:acetyl-CoA synthetase
MTDTGAERFIAARDLLRRLRVDYDEARRAFRWPELDRFNWALDYFDAMAAGNSGIALWIVDEAGGEMKLSFAEMAERSNRLANWWRGLGVKRGDRILMMLGNVAPVWECLLAAMKLGAVIIPATTLLTREDLLDRFARGRVRHVITAAEETEKFADIAGDYTRIAVRGAAGWRRYEDCYEASPKFRPEGETAAADPLLLYFTSGTTAKPKLVLHSHQSYPVGHLSTMYWLGLQPGDLHLNISTPGWAKHAWSCVFAPWNAEAGVFIYNQARFQAKGLLDAITRCGVTTFCAPPTVWRLLIQEDLPRWKTKLRQLTGAGEPLNPEVIARVEAAWGLTIRDGYGQTETTAQIGNSPGQKVKPGAMGRPLPGYRIALLDPDGNEAAEGEIAILTAPAPTGLMQGYQDEDGRLRPLPPGAYRTGDVASRDAEGFYTYVGRADDLFKSSDYRVSPFELESAMIEHAAVAEAAVVPSPDPVRLAVPKAFLVLAPGHAADRATALAIFRHVAKSLAPYKRVRRIEFTELPKTISGKIRRVELRAREATMRGRNERAALEFWEEDFPELRG